MKRESLKIAESIFADRGDLRDAVYAAIVNERKATLAYKLCRLRHKLVWFGGWERANCGGFQIKGDPFPLTLLSALTLFGHWLQLRLPGRTYLVIGFREKFAYVSPDGTPGGATRWLWGKPRWA